MNPCNLLPLKAEPQHVILLLSLPHNACLETAPSWPPTLPGAWASASLFACSICSSFSVSQWASELFSPLAGMILCVLSLPTYPLLQHPIMPQSFNPFFPTLAGGATVSSHYTYPPPSHLEAASFIPLHPHSPPPPHPPPYGGWASHPSPSSLTSSSSSSSLWRLSLCSLSLLRGSFSSYLRWKSSSSWQNLYSD